MTKTPINHTNDAAQRIASRIRSIALPPAPQAGVQNVDAAAEYLVQTIERKLLSSADRGRE